MFAELLIASAFQIGPFWQQHDGSKALCPFWSNETVPASAREAEVDTTDVLWPVFTSHRDWWRFCFFTHYQEQGDDSWQFEIMPLWFNGRNPDEGSYWGLFPIWGHHPHILLTYDLDFCLWPLWMRYRSPRPSAPSADGQWLTSNVILFPFFHWRDDGSWGVWPLCGAGYRRESDHYYALWPIVTWASYRADRDTSGAGYSWMFWPLWTSVERERESQWMFVPPLFGYAKTRDGMRLRTPWPLFELERTRSRRRISAFPFYEDVSQLRYSDGVADARTIRFGWRLVELYYGENGSLKETRVFPFWTRNTGGFFRMWPFWSKERVDDKGEVSHVRCLELFPIRWVDSIDRNWAPYWTFYESLSNPIYTDHSLFWGIIRWRTYAD